jgi:hypothetical protein
VCDNVWRKLSGEAVLSRRDTENVKVGVLLGLTGKKSCNEVFSISGLPECVLLVNHPPRGTSDMDRCPAFHENFRTPWHVS